ncbi:hypothetical protein GQ43DRAFT_474013 [Delitschia confertaspora ATCC 74209]|uniref:endo-1,3(4)-beta-glucanase n=1 Tax=Delitschia confertaspora ATCC 74209 TaxID=1513339 RepID=A0A9P4JH62_9PLEO|nr:hypothetical protein GQ43DRAFT_474013 [Delitschia confertaspora ATCC 74209]
MSFKCLVACTSLLLAGVQAVPSPLAKRYTLADVYDHTNWLDKFNTLAMADPTHGYVNYVDANTALNAGIMHNQGANQVYMGVDTSSVLDPNGLGRMSVRLSSKKSYTHALVIADFAHVPGPACGSWPAFWMVGPTGNWPNQGEIDILEGINLNTDNQVTLHTSPGCVPSVGSGGMTGTPIGEADCGAGGGYNGCGVASHNGASYGTGFNANGGGVYATLWTSSGIKVWYFASANVPSDIRSGNPNPNGWGTPQANYAGCNFDAHFSNMNLVFDITFCGDWAGSAWGSSTCSRLASSCPAYVAANPAAFKDTYWVVNDIKVYNV